jgi:hypothetical protein
MFASPEAMWELKNSDPKFKSKPELIECYRYSKILDIYSRKRESTGYMQTVVVIAGSLRDGEKIKDKIRDHRRRWDIEVREVEIERRSRSKDRQKERERERLKEKDRNRKDSHGRDHHRQKRSTSASEKRN